MRVWVLGVVFRRLPVGFGESGVQKCRAGQASGAGGASERLACVGGLDAGGLVMRAFVAHALARVFRRVRSQQHEPRTARAHGFDRQVGADGELAGFPRQSDEP